jgi:poly-gamma-glutamate synthesis protein (capsule biosynthesis protein)
MVRKLREMVRIKILLLLIGLSSTLIGLSSTLAAQDTLKLVFTGDIMGHDTQIASALATGDSGYDYKPCFEYVEPYLKKADLVIGNLEVTFAGPPYKGYPQFSSPDELADALKWAGFDILVTANNHALDRRQKGLERTLEQLDLRGIPHAGTYAGPEIRQTHYPLVVEKNGIRIALLNYTYGTNGIKVPPPSIVNRIDTTRIKLDLLKAASAEPDFIIVTMHWGNEYQTTESAVQRELAAFLFKHGAHAIIGSHPHVVQPVRGDGKGSLVAYSMGNLISNQRDRYRNGGIAFELELVKGEREQSDRKVITNKRETEILSFGYLPLWVWKPQTKTGTRFTLVPANLDPDSITQLGMSAEDRNKMNQFLKDTQSNLEGIPICSPR